MTAAEVAGVWLGMIYARPDLPPVKQRDVLVTLAVGKQFEAKASDERVAATEALRAACGSSRSTVQRALRWARRMMLLVCVKRGHRISEGVTTETCWRLVIA